jgi:uncharacterized protein (TIGR02996 family)
MDDMLKRLLEGCKRHPEGRTLFGVLADYLEEHGDPRAELIRLECRLAEVDDDDPEQQELTDRKGELIARYQDEWVGPLPSLDCKVEHFGGFVHLLSARAEVLLGEQGRRLLDWPGWIWVDSALLRGRIPAERWQSPVLASLSGLTLRGRDRRCRGTGTGRLSLSRQPHEPRSGKQPDRRRRGGGAGCFSLPGQPHRAEPARQFLLRQLARGQPIRQLDRRHGAKALARSPYLSKLTWLDLEGNRIGDAGAQALAGSPFLPNLTTLNLRFNQIGDVGAQAFATLPRLPRLNCHNGLDLYGNRIGATGAEVLVNSPNLPSICFGFNPIGDSGVEALTASPNLANLEWLDLRESQLTVVGVRALANCPHLVNLGHLQLEFNEIGDAGAMALAASPYLARLTSVWLTGNQISEVGAWALVESPYLTNLTSLNLQHNAISDAEAERLRARFGGRIDV